MQVDQDMVSQLNDGTNKYPDKYGLEHFVNWIMCLFGGSYVNDIISNRSISSFVQG